VSCRYLLAGRGYHSVKSVIGLSQWMNRLFWYILRADVCLVHVFDFDSAIPVAIACRLRRIPFVYDIFDNFELRYGWPRLVKALIARVDRAIARRAAVVLVQDENRIIGGIAAEREKVVVIEPCAPDYGKPRYPASGEPFTVYAMGFLGLRRGVGMLLDAAEALPDVRFLLAGNFVEGALKERAERLPNVRSAGYVSWTQATELAWESDVVFAFFDPEYEINRRAAAQKFYEAMMAGRPILCNREILKAAWIERSGIGFSCKYDRAVLQAKIRELANSRQECRARGDRARQLFEEEYNWPEMERRLYAAIQRGVPSLAGHRTPEAIPGENPPLRQAL
jgi:glycosyltransferase involved in cell wall biosynthesis